MLPARNEATLGASAFAREIICAKWRWLGTEANQPELTRKRGLRYRQGVTLLRTLEQDLSNGLAFDPNGNALASSSNGGYTVKLWEPRSGKLLRELDARHVVTLAFHQGGLLATGGDDHEVKLWNPQSGALLSGHSKGTRARS